MTFRRRDRCLCAALIALAGASGLVPAMGQEAPAVPPIVQRFLDRDEEQLTTYKALRRLEAHNERYDKHGWIEAWTTLDPQAGFHYEVVTERGSPYICKNVLRKVLDREQQAFRARESHGAAIAPGNYAFDLAGPGADGLVSVSLKPRRKDGLLLNGTLHLTPGDADMVRIEGRLAKSPSFWTRRVDVIRRYARISNVRVPVVVESTARVIVAGESSFVMRYEYTSINGREVAEPQPASTAWWTSSYVAKKR